MSISDKLTTIAENVSKVYEAGSKQYLDILNSVISGSIEEITTDIFDGETIKIKENCFSMCKSLKTAIIPSHISQIFSSAFYYCEALESVEIQGDISCIDVNTYRGCISLKTFKCKDVTTIYYGAFMNCTALEILDFSESTIVPRLPDGYSSSFSGVPSTCKVIVPDALWEDWIAADEWKTAYENNSLVFVKASEAV